MIKAIAYSRVSTQTQAQKDEVSLDTQIDAIEDYANANGFSIISEIREVFTGAELFERPLLNEAREAIRSGAAQALIVYDIDRLSRNIGHLAILLDECTRYNAKLLFVRTEYNDSIEGKILFSIQGIFAEAERLKIIERTTRGRRAKAANKTLSFKRKLYGYDLDDSGKRIVNEAESEIVRGMFAQMIAGKSLRSIAEDLTRRSIPTPAGKSVWWANSVKVLLDNPAYCGHTYAFRYKKFKRYEKGASVLTSVLTEKEAHVELDETLTPAIVSEKDFERVQEVLQHNRKRKRGAAKREFLLRGILRCGNCGRLMSPQVSYNYRSYVCTSKQSRQKDCRMKMCGAEKAEILVWELVSEIIKTPKLIKRHIKAALKNDGSVERDLKQVRATLHRAEKEIGNLIERGAGLSSDLWEAVKEKIENKQLELNRLKEAARELEKRAAQTLPAYDEKSFNALLLKIRPHLNNLTFAEKVGILRQFKVTCLWTGAEIIFRTGDKQYGSKSDFNSFDNTAVFIPAMECRLRWVRRFPLESV